MAKRLGCIISKESANTFNCVGSNYMQGFVNK